MKLKVWKADLPFCEPVLIVVSGAISACTEVRTWELNECSVILIKSEEISH